MSEPVPAHASLDLATGEVSGDPRAQGRLIVKVHGAPVGMHELEDAPPDDEQLLHELTHRLRTTLLPLLAHPTDRTGVATALAEGAAPRHGLAPDPRRLSPGELTVAICTNRGPDACSPLLSELAGVLDVIVMEQGNPAPGLRDVADEFGAGHEHHPGTTKAQRMNRAMEATSSDWVLFLDDDCRVGERAGRMAAELGGAIDRVPDAGAITGVLVPAALAGRADINFQMLIPMQRGWVPLRHHLTSSDLPHWPTRDAHLMGVGACLCVRREAWLEVGGFDERLGPGSPARFAEDDDFLASVVSHGWSVFYDPGLVVSHHHDMRKRRIWREVYGYGIGRSTRLILGARSSGALGDLRPLRSLFGDHLRHLLDLNRLNVWHMLGLIAGIPRALSALRSRRRGSRSPGN